MPATFFFTVAATLLAVAAASGQDGVDPALLRLDAPLSLPSSSAVRADIDAAIRTANWERAERLLAAEIEQRPGARDLLLLIARVFFVDGKPLNAAIALKKADAIQPLDDDLRLTLALAYVRLGRGEWARPELERLVASRPDHAAYRYWIGRLEYDAGQYAAAIARFREALARDPGSMRAHDNLGLCYEALDEPDKAIIHYREAIRLNRQSASRSPWPLLNLAILLRSRGELEEAEALLREALEYDRSFARAHYQLGVVFEQQGHMDTALAALKRAAELDPQYAEPHYVMGRIYRRQNARDRAEQALATFLRLRTQREGPR